MSVVHGTTANVAGAVRNFRISVSLSNGIESDVNRISKLCRSLLETLSDSVVCCFVSMSVLAAARHIVGWEFIIVVLYCKCWGVGEPDWLGFSVHWSGASDSTQHYMWVVHCDFDSCLLAVLNLTDWGFLYIDLALLTPLSITCE